MSLLYDPQSKKPQVWTYGVFVVAVLLVLFAIYYYGMQKEQQHAGEQTNNALFEQVSE